MVISLDQIPQALVLGIVGFVLIFCLALPIALKLAGLTAVQIAEAYRLTIQFFTNLVDAFRVQNAEGEPKSRGK